MNLTDERVKEIIIGAIKGTITTVILSAVTLLLLAMIGYVIISILEVISRIL